MVWPLGMGGLFHGCYDFISNRHLTSSQGHTGAHDKPEEADLLDLMLDWVPDEKVRNAILADNPGKLYDFDD